MTQHSEMMEKLDNIANIRTPATKVNYTTLISVIVEVLILITLIVK